MVALDWGYEMAVDRVPGLDTAEELAKSYIQLSDNMELTLTPTEQVQQVARDIFAPERLILV